MSLTYLTFGLSNFWQYTAKWFDDFEEFNWKANKEQTLVYTSPNQMQISFFNCFSKCLLYCTIVNAGLVSSDHCIRKQFYSRLF